MTTFAIGDRVSFALSVLKRTDRAALRASGVVVGGCGPNAVRVDWQGTWIANEDGSTIRAVPTANLVKLRQQYTPRSDERASEASWLEGMGV